MAAQGVNTEIRPALNAVCDIFRSDVFSKLRSGMEHAVEVAEKSGSAKFLKDSQEASESAEALIKELDSLVDCCDRYNEQLKRLEDAL